MLPATELGYLVPRGDWESNLEAFAGGARVTQEEAQAQQNLDRLNTQGKIMFSVAVAVAGIGMGILLGLTLHPACFALCFAALIPAASIMKDAWGEYHSLKTDLSTKHQATALICEDMIREIDTLRENATHGAFLIYEDDRSAAVGWRDREEALKASNRYVQKWFENTNYRVRQFQKITSLVNRINLHDGDQGDSQKNVCIALDCLVNGNIYYHEGGMRGYHSLLPKQDNYLYRWVLVMGS